MAFGTGFDVFVFPVFLRKYGLLGFFSVYMFYCVFDILVLLGESHWLFGLKVFVVGSYVGGGGLELEICGEGFGLGGFAGFIYFLDFCLVLFFLVLLLFLLIIWLGSFWERWFYLCIVLTEII